MEDEATLAYGGHVTRALLGVDALYRTESGDQDGLVVLNLDTERRYPEDAFTDYAAARERFEALRTEAQRLPDADRRLYYDQLCHSTLAFIAWRDGGLPFQEQLTRFLHVPAAPAGVAELDRIREDMHALLNGMGYGGELSVQCRRWEERTRVPADELVEVLTVLLVEAWERTEERVVAIPAPRSDGMRVAPVSDVAFNARCDYARRTIELNTDPVLTRPALKHLAVHEGCPGHYLQFKLRETLARSGEATPDVLLSVVNTASSAVFEGIADAGLAAIAWVESDDDRLQALMNRYRAGIGTAAAWRLHALGWDEGDVTDWLRRRSLVGGDGWVEGRMRFIAAPARAVLVWSYWWGERVVSPVWTRVGPGEGAAFVHFLYGRMHSVETVGMFGG
jgi:hypothetical protein